MTEPKHKFRYGPEDRPALTKQEAIGEMEKFMEHVSNHSDMAKLEPVWYLFLQEDRWCVVAGSVADSYGDGERIQEFKVEEG
ncbi:MAG: hypothetical protein KAJ19_07755 [Gammaproteobacteria bacterium]|nr:hypothetical protein [Gammaproteobacteria bacterium]